MKQDKTTILLTYTGMTTALAVIVPLLLKHQTNLMFAVIASLALGVGFITAFTEYYVYEQNDFAYATRLGIISAVAIFAPSIPFFLFSPGWAALLTIALTIGYAYHIGKLRNRPDAIHEILLATAAVAVFGIVAVWIGS